MSWKTKTIVVADCQNHVGKVTGRLAMDREVWRDADGLDCAAVQRESEP